MFQSGFWTSVLFVGLGGFIGASCRYALGLISVKIDFPVMTFIINIIGAILIGIVVSVSANLQGVSPNAVLFFKTGLCGGFTTFSTFSLETLTLIENGHIPTACGYAGLSVVCCVIGVFIGKIIGDAISIG